MSRSKKTLQKVLLGTSDRNVEFEELRGLLIHLNFEERIRGSHHIYTRDGITEILNIQPKGSKAKPYQVKQVRETILKYGLSDELGG